MWRLMQAELNYVKSYLMIGYTISIMFFLSALIWKQVDIFIFATHTSINYFIWMGICGSESDKEKRTRYLSVVPMPRRNVCLTDLLFVNLFQGGMVVLWVMLLLIRPETGTANTPWGLVSLNGLILSLIAVLMIHTHLGFFAPKKYKWITYGLLMLMIFAVVILQFFGYYLSILEFVLRQLVRPAGAFFATMLWLSLSYLSVVIFNRRRSYLA